MCRLGKAGAPDQALILKLSAYFAGSLPSHTTPSSSLLVRMASLGTLIFMALATDTRYSMLVHPAIGGTITAELKQVTLPEGRHLPVFCQKVAGFADGTDDISHYVAILVFPHRLHPMVRAVQGWAGQVVHGRVHDHEILFLSPLGVEAFPDHDARVAHEVSARLE